MKIYIVHIDALDGKRPFNEITNEEIEKMYYKGTMLIDCYNSIEEFSEYWNNAECFDPDVSYMRVIND